MNTEIFNPIADKMNSEYLLIDSVQSQITLQIQDGPVQVNGINGIQIDVIGEIWLEILRGFNRVFPCRENSLTITKIEEALMWQKQRKSNREKRSVEGLNKE